jgi:hypothetical protein
MNIPVKISQLIDLTDVRKPVVKTILFNTCCRYYNTPGGCKKGRICPFLHEEKPFERCVFLNGTEPLRIRSTTSTAFVANSEPEPGLVSPVVTEASTDVQENQTEPGPLCEARIYIGNIPAEVPKEAIEAIGKKYGTVKYVHNLNSVLRNGRHACFMIMTSEAQAKLTITKINDMTFSDAQLYAKLEDVKQIRQLKSTPRRSVDSDKPSVDSDKPSVDSDKPSVDSDKPHKSPKEVTPDGFIVSNAKSRAAVQTPLMLSTTSRWALLIESDEDSEEDSDEEEDEEDGEEDGEEDDEEDNKEDDEEDDEEDVELPMKDMARMLATTSETDDYLEENFHGLPNMRVMSPTDHDSPVSVLTGVWNDSGRSRNMRDELAQMTTKFTKFKNMKAIRLPARTSSRESEADELEDDTEFETDEDESL